MPYALISLSVDASEIGMYYFLECVLNLIGLYMGIINVFQVASQLIANFIASLLMNNYWVNVTLGKFSFVIFCACSLKVFWARFLLELPLESYTSHSVLFLPSSAR